MAHDSTPVPSIELGKLLQLLHKWQFREFHPGARRAVATLMIALQDALQDRGEPVIIDGEKVFWPDGYES